MRKHKTHEAGAILKDITLPETACREKQRKEGLE